MTVKVIKSGNPDYVREMQGRRRSPQTSPHRNKSKYDRKSKYPEDHYDE